MDFKGEDMLTNGHRFITMGRVTRAVTDEDSIEMVCYITIQISVLPFVSNNIAW